jgi:hypothetical protein
MVLDFPCKMDWVRLTNCNWQALTNAGEDAGEDDDMRTTATEKIACQRFRTGGARRVSGEQPSRHAPHPGGRYGTSAFDPYNEPIRLGEISSLFDMSGAAIP